MLGEILGLIDGDIEALGLVEGEIDGDIEGEIDSLGLTDGEILGLILWEIDGDVDGLILGEMEGEVEPAGIYAIIIPVSNKETVVSDVSVVTPISEPVPAG